MGLESGRQSGEEIGAYQEPVPINQGGNAFQSGPPNKAESGPGFYPKGIPRRKKPFPSLYPVATATKMRRKPYMAAAPTRAPAPRPPSRT